MESAYRHTGAGSSTKLVEFALESGRRQAQTGRGEFLLKPLEQFGSVISAGSLHHQSYGAGRCLAPLGQRSDIAATSAGVVGAASSGQRMGKSPESGRK